jgi:hypothetical protein
LCEGENAAFINVMDLMMYVVENLCNVCTWESGFGAR